MLATLQLTLRARPTSLLVPLVLHAVLPALHVDHGHIVWLAGCSSPLGSVDTVVLVELVVLSLLVVLVVLVFLDHRHIVWLAACSSPLGSVDTARGG